MSMLVENTTLIIIAFLAKHGQENLSIDHTYIHEVKELTRGQSANLIWQYQRKGRLTVSNFYNVFHIRGTSTGNYIVKNIMGKYLITSKSVDRGNYMEYMAGRYPSFHCFETGIFVGKEFSFFPCSFTR